MPFKDKVYASLRAKELYQLHKEKKKEYQRQYYYDNKEVLQQKIKEYWQRVKEQPHHQDRIFNNRIKRVYGIDKDQYEALLEKQDGKCAICKRTESEASYPAKFQKDKRLAIDHCHTTGKVRGLLCGLCNRRLGVYEKDKDAFELYLRVYGQ